jgi:hypothetical protein
MGAIGVRRIVSRIYRWFRASWTFLTDLPVHFQASGKDLPSLPHRICEQGRLLFSSGITPTNYYRYRLYRRDLSHDDKAMFLGFFEGWRWLLAVNGRMSPLLADDKLITARLLQSCGVPQPECLGIFGLKHGLLDPTASARLRSELTTFLSGCARGDLFLKPVYGRAGKGHFSLGRCLKPGAEWAVIPSGAPITADELVAQVTALDVPYMVQARRTPHPGLACFGTDVLHTIRFVTVLDGDVRIAQAALKIALGKVPVDNMMKGNAVAPIDLASGMVGPGCVMDMTKPLILPIPLDLHPKTGSRIEGQQLPLWQETVDTVKRAAACFYLNSVVAWDVAITDRGPIIIEANGDPNWPLTQLPNDRGLVATVLGDYLYRHGHLEKVGAGIGLKAAYERVRGSGSRAAGPD